jgi:site-specific recombinase XerD
LRYTAARNSAKYVLAQAGALERWRRFLEERGVMRVVDVTTADVAAFAPWRQSGGAGVVSCNRDLAMVRAFGSWCVRTERMKDNPFSRVPVAREFRGTRGVEVVDLEAFERVLVELSERWRNAAVALLGSGMRWRSLAQLEARDLDEARRVVTLRRPKGKRSLELQVSERTFLALGRCVEAGRLSADVGAFDKAVDLACYRAGVPRWTAHKLRHTFAVTCIQNGANVRDLQEWLGHASLSTTEIYLRFSRPKAPPAPI